MCHLLGMRFPATLESVWIESMYSVAPIDTVLFNSPRLADLTLRNWRHAENDELNLTIGQLTALTALDLKETRVSLPSLASTSLRKLCVGDLDHPEHMLLGEPDSLSLLNLPNLSELCTEANLCFGNNESELQAAARQLRGLTMLLCSSDADWVDALPQLTSLTSLVLRQWMKDFAENDDEEVLIVPPSSLVKLEIGGQTEFNDRTNPLALDLQHCTRLAELTTHNVELIEGSLGRLSTSLQQLEIDGCDILEGELLGVPASVLAVKLHGCRVVALNGELRPVCIADLSHLSPAKVDFKELSDAS